MHISRLVQFCLAVMLTVGIALGGVLLPTSGALAASSLTLSRGTAAPGDHITVIGNGFTAGDDAVVSSDVLVNNKHQHVQTSATAGGNGVFSATFTVPHGTNQGNYQMVARDFHGHSATHGFTVLPNAYVKAGSNGYTVFVVPGHQFYVSGSGFTASETVTIRADFPLYNGNTTVVSRTYPTSTTGTFYEALVTTPRNAKAGILALTVTGQTSKKTARDTLHVIYRPRIAVDAAAYRPGTAIHVFGAAYVPGSSINVSVTIPRTNSSTITVSRTATADSFGRFSIYLTLPTSTAVGTYTVSARESNTGFRASTQIRVSVHPTIAVKPGSAYSGQSIDVSGSNFGTGTTVHIVGQFSVGNGQFAYVSRYTRSDGHGNYFTSLVVPGNAQPSTATVTASTGNARVSTHVQIQARPTAVPKPTATATNAPTSVPTGVPTATPQPTTVKNHRPKLGYRYISIWYHTMTEGTTEHIVVQSTVHTTQGIWVHVWFPAHGNYAYFENTDSQGQWSKVFLVPHGSSSSGNDMALVTFRLWHGKTSIKEYQHFKIIK